MSTSPCLSPLLDEAETAYSTATKTILNLHSPACDFHTQAGEPCSFSARWLMVNAERSVVGACQKHRPARWDDPAFAGRVVDCEAYECEATRKPLPEGEERDPLALDDPPTPRDYDCEFDAAILFVYHHSDDDPYAACLHHARPSWVADLGRD
jgi:hypothetical protein